MAVPVLASSGAADATTASTSDVPYPSGINAGDLLILAFSQNATAPDTPTNWALEKTQTEAGHRLNVYSKIATGSESGTLTVTKNTSTVSLGRMHRFTGADTLEGILGSNASSKIIDHPDIVTTGVDRLAVAFSSTSDDNTAISFTGETGGDLTLDFQDETIEGTDHSLSLQTAPMSSAGTIAGGTWEYTGATDSWATISFAIFEAAAPSGRIMGSIAGEGGLAGAGGIAGQGGGLAG